MKFRNCCAIAYALMIAVLLTGCAGSSLLPNTATTARAQYPGVIERAKKDKWYLMLHSGVNLYSITSVELDKAKQQLTVQLDKPDSLHGMQGITPGNSPATQQKDNTAPLPEMHVYLSDSLSYTLDEPHTIVLDKVARIERVR